MSRFVCPYCGKDFEAHAGELCPVLDASMTKQIRGVLQTIQNERDTKVKQLALSTVAPPRLVKITNGANDLQQLLNANFDRGCAIVYNDDAADVLLSIARQHITEADKRFLIKAKSGILFTSPTELWATGTTAGPQAVYVWDLPPGRQAAEFAQLLGAIVGSSAPAAMRLQDGASAQLATILASGAIVQSPAASGVAANAPNNANPGALAASQVVKAAAGTLFAVSMLNTNAAARFLQIFDANALPADATVPLISIPVAIGAFVSRDLGTYGRKFANGIVICNSSTAATKTIGAADSLFDTQFV